MESEKTEIDQSSKWYLPLTRITPLSKYLALTLFIILPFIGGWVGYNFAPEKEVEVGEAIKINKQTVVKEIINKDSEIEKDEVANKKSLF